MKLKSAKLILFALVASTLIISGCATTVQPQSTKRYVWPAPPNPPKIEWLKSYYGENDFPKSGFTIFLEALFGTPSVRTFDKPIDIKSDGKGVVYVADIMVNAIFVFDLVNYTIDIWAVGTDPEKNLGITPYFLALDDKDNVYVSGKGRNEVYVLDKAGRVQRRINIEGKVKSSGGIAVDSKSGRLFLVDTSESKVAVFSVNGDYLFSFGRSGDGNGEFNRPAAVTINRRGEVLVGDTHNARVQFFDIDGKFLRKFGQRGDGNADFQIMKGVSTDSEDNVYVTDGKANQVKIFDTNGNFLMGLGASYSIAVTRKEAPGGFLLPQGIHVDKNDSIFIADQANRRFQHFKYLKDEPLKEQEGPAPKSPK